MRLRSRSTRVWGTGPDDVLVLTRDQVFHFDGTDWTDMDTPYSKFWADMIGRSAADVYAVGDEGAVMHYDGVGWTLMDVPTVCDLDGLAVVDGAVYATGGNGVPIMLRLD